MAKNKKAKSVLTSVIGAAIDKAKRDRGVADLPTVPAALEKALVDAGAGIPEVVNAVSAEPLTQSRIMWGLGIAAAGTSGLAGLGLAEAFAAVADVLAAFGVDFTAELQARWVTAGNGVVTLLGLLYGLYGRVANGLPPMWRRLKALRDRWFPRGA